MSDREGTAPLLPVLPPARELLGDRGYDSNCFPAVLIRCGIPSNTSCKTPLP